MSDLVGNPQDRFSRGAANFNLFVTHQTGISSQGMIHSPLALINVVHWVVCGSSVVKISHLSTV